MKSRKSKVDLRKSCTECARRKQKCNREWPCNHCQTRRVLHLCHYKSSDGTVPERTLSNALEETRNESSLPGDEEIVGDSGISNEATWSGLGYAQGIDHFNLGTLNSAPISAAVTQTGDDVENAVQSLPVRYITDALVHDYLDSANYTYYSLQPQVFLATYANWWAARLAREHLPPSFTCLLLQVCANALQAASPEICQQYEDFVGCHVEGQSERLHIAANALSDSIVCGRGGLHKAHQLIIAAAWLKSEGRITEAWHLVALSVREQQECGMHNQGARKKMSQLDAELTTRLGCLTVLWDWQMAEWLSRPMLVDLRMHGMQEPNLRLDESNEFPISPFASAFLQYKLVYSLSVRFGRLSQVTDLERVLEIQRVIDDWFADFPEPFIEAKDLSSYHSQPYLAYQRAQLHAFANMVRLTPFKSHLTTFTVDIEHGNQTLVQKMGIRACLNSAANAQNLLALMSPLRCNFHFAIFSLFDTASLMCSAILHGVTDQLPERSAVLSSISEAQKTLAHLAPTSKAALKSRAVLAQLTRQLPKHAEKVNLLRDKEEMPCALLTDDIHPSEISTKQAQASGNGFSESSGFRLDEQRAQTPAAATIDQLVDSSLIFQDHLDSDLLDNMDMGGIEQIWDWQGLRFDS